MKTRAAAFYGGVALLCMCVLMLQIIQTRLLSVTAHYHLAFFAISMAMFGLTGGAVWVFLRGERFQEQTLSADLAWASIAFAVSTTICLIVQLTSFTGLVASASLVVVWLKLVVLLATPFFFAGVAVSLALTRSPFPIGRVYAADLMGAGVGCLAVMGLLRALDGPSAVIAVAACAAVSSALFAASRIGGPAPHRGRLVAWTHRPWTIAVALAALAAINASTMHGLQPVLVKNRVERRDGSWLFEKWNSFSRIAAVDFGQGRPLLWGPSPTMPSDLSARAIYLNVDGNASTTMFAFDGAPEKVRFLQYDVTNLAYHARAEGRAAVIGVGGGRDLLSAYTFGFRDITGVELNPIFVELLRRREPYRSFAGLDGLEGIRLYVDEARSWFARSDESYDLIQMSMIDTWAATGAGAFSLSENGLYTVEGWKRFLARLTPGGLFTVSRWHAPGNVDETGRAVSLAVATLLELGVAEPAEHLFLAGTTNLATLIVSLQPLAPSDLDALHAAVDRFEFEVLASPRSPTRSDLLDGILRSRSVAEMDQHLRAYPLDLTAPRDARPFFFNQLRLNRVSGWKDLPATLRTGGVQSGNIMATGTLLVVLLVSLGLVVATILVPLRPTFRSTQPGLAFHGTAYFLLIGLGFMFLEIGLLQRCTIVLGHPIYSLSVVLFGLVLATGLGSLLSDRVPLRTGGRFVVWSLVVTVYYLAIPHWLPTLASAAESSGIVTRAAAVLAAVVPGGLLLGFGFPTGMRLVEAIDRRPTPWFWGINGAAGVLAAGGAVAVSMTYGIDWSLRLGALCYLGLIPAALRLGGETARACRR